MPSGIAGLKGHTKVNILVTLKSSTADGGSPEDHCEAQEYSNLYVNQQDQPQFCFPSQGHGLPGYEKAQVLLRPSLSDQGGC